MTQYKTPQEFSEFELALADIFDADHPLRNVSESYYASTIKRALEIAALLPLVEWQPIETAPKDGKYILLVDYFGDVKKALFYSKEINGPNSPMQRGNGFWAESWDDTVYKPTHWMPLPKPPTPAASTATEMQKILEGETK